MKRVFLFLATNLAVIVVLGIVLNILFVFLGIPGILDAQGQINIAGLMLFAALFGFGGSFISLAMSKFIAKKSMGVQIISTPDGGVNTASLDPKLQRVVQTVKQQAKRKGIGEPEIGVFDSPTPNAFATGARRDKSLVAVSTGLLQNMSDDEVDAVLGHEVSHVANGDMVTLALIQGVVNTFVIALARVVGVMVDRHVFGNEDGYGVGYFVTSIIAEIIFAILASTIVMWFSRQREFRADSGGAALTSREAMANALGRLKAMQDAPEDMPSSMRAFGIRSGGSSFGRLFMSHPPLEERIEALRRAA
ncbi:probable protease htpX homolog [Halorhodospira halochloris]|uniref:Protease HtpX n=1 Tax=Halorhodospira halochloris TaxID=1052 RepID=A0A110B4Y9_HALHR|nr:protease HtpX [Halorhodospira halochloris]MBK1651131.1 zinc metalloprotease HtpX [Halorhodospira halochloris]BAU57400.1 probable protease htpX homolog [Halorhodospira halochloris]